MMDYSYRVEKANGYDYPEYAASQSEPYDEAAVRWSAYRTMTHSDDLTTMVRGVQGMTQMVLAEKDNQVVRLREVIELMVQRISALANEKANLQRQTNTMAAEIVRLRGCVAELETEHVPAPNCEHGLPRDCCAICAEARERGRVYEWNANVRAGGEYQE